MWDSFDPQLMTLCSPDPQAFRPPDEKINVLQVRLPTNFVGALSLRRSTRILQDLEKGIEAVREGMELPVKLKVHESVFVPLAKWAMLMAGNYRCVTKDGMIPIKEAVHRDLGRRAVYDWVVKLCVSSGRTKRTSCHSRSTPRRRKASRTLVRGARPVWRCAQHRACRSPGARRRGTQGMHAGDRRGGRARRRAPGAQSPRNAGVAVSTGGQKKTA